MAWSDEALEALRSVGDPLADGVVADLSDRGAIASANALLADLRRNGQALPDGLPAALATYFETTAQLPPWADAALIRRGEGLFRRLGMDAVMVLFCSSLPQCYACENGAHVLGFTGRLLGDTRRRIVETAQFVLDVMDDGGLGPRGRGVRSAQKVRLMHAAIRHMASASPEWRGDLWGLPINQEDLAGTLLTFATVVLDGLKQLGAELKEADERAYLHVWRVIGHILGVREDLLASMQDPADARELFAAISARQRNPSDVGRALAAALVEFLEEMTPGTMFDGFPPRLMRHLVGDEVADNLALAQAQGDDLLLSLLRNLTRFADGLQAQSAVIAHVSAYFSQGVLTGLEWVQRGDREVTFAIPPALRHDWRLSARHPLQVTHRARETPRWSVGLRRPLTRALRSLAAAID